MLYHSQGLYVPGVVVPSHAGKPLLRAYLACVLSLHGQQMAQGAAYVS